MKTLEWICAGDRTLVRIVDQAVAEAERRSGSWIACRIGCTACCLGLFPITQLDALRLRRAMEELKRTDPERAQRVTERARAAIDRLAPLFPGDPATGVLPDDDAAQERFFDSAGDEPCPALDPETGACELYAARPITCRTFGPAVQSAGEPLDPCELCYAGASPAQIEACRVDFDPDGLEAMLVAELEAAGLRGQTIVAFALAGTEAAAGPASRR